MRIWLIRHSNAVEADEFDGPDIARPLTRQGRIRARRFFRALSRRRQKPDAVVCSAAIRARETAELFCEAFKMPPARRDADLNPDVSWRSVIKALRRHRRNIDLLVVIGHEPTLSGAASQLTTGGPGRIKLKKCGLIELEMPARGRALLVDRLDPG